VTLDQINLECVTTYMSFFSYSCLCLYFFLSFLSFFFFLLSIGNPSSPDALALSPDVSLSPPSDAHYLASLPGESCTEACERTNKELYSKEKETVLSCDESLFSLISRSCILLNRLLGCSHCEEEIDPEFGLSTPGRQNKFNNNCKLGKGKYSRCNAKHPQEIGWIRACVCKKRKNIITTTSTQSNTVSDTTNTDESDNKGKMSLFVGGG
jgi:hypothetical protein